MKKVSVIIPFYNSLESLDACLLALRGQTYPAAAFEVIAIDNGSTADSSALRARYPEVRWLTEVRPGSYHARNLGIRHAGGEIIALTDSDCVPAPVWLEAAVAALGAMPATIVGGRIDYFGPEGRDLNVYERFEDRFFMLARHRFLVEQKGVVATANVVAERGVFERTGDFDSRLMSFADGEWALRATAQGEVLRYAEGALVRHPRRGTFREVFKKVKRIAGDRVVLIRQRREGTKRLLGDLWRHSVLDPRVHRQALSFPQLVGWQRVQMAALVEVLSLATTLEKLRVLGGGQAFRG